MLVKQISVFIENKTGTLYDVCHLLAANNINLSEVTVADATDFGILRALTNDLEKAVSILSENHYVVSVNELIAIDVLNQPGGLAEVLSILDKEEISINYLYSFTTTDARAVILLKVSDTTKALDILQKNNVKMYDAPLV